MELVHEIERQLQTFHGFRHLWANLVANHEQCGLTQEQLETLQHERLTAALSLAYTLSKDRGCEWSGCNADRDFIREIANDGCSYGDNCPPTGTHHGQCRACKAKEVLHRHFQ
jgi:hypothetical protein